MRGSLAVPAAALMAAWIVFAAPASAHPGSGIVVDEKGQVFFQDSGGRAIWKIDARGKLTKYSERLGGHWMALDPEGRFSRGKVKYFERISPDGVRPALIVADGGAPIVVNRDGNLYYSSWSTPEDEMAPGALTVTRMSPDGTRTQFAPELRKRVEKLGITGLAAGPDGSLYVACPSAVLKVKLDGTFTTLVQPVRVQECDEELPDNNVSPYLRGLAVDPQGSVYAAATGCHCVVKISSDGKTETVLKAERPWTPTGVALFGGDVYVLEYANHNSGNAPGQEWQPRVRKLGRDGKVTTLVVVPPQRPAARP
jgi:sugar lactone lactonase YvrE